MFLQLVLFFHFFVLSFESTESHCPANSIRIPEENDEFCPCLDSTNFNTSCLIEKIENSGPINEGCMKIIHNLLPTVSLEIADHGAFDCKAEYQSYVQLWGKKVEMNISDCQEPKKKVSIAFENEEVFRLWAAQLESNGEDPILCHLNVAKRIRKLTSCTNPTLHVDQCGFLSQYHSKERVFQSATKECTYEIQEKFHFIQNRLVRVPSLWYKSRMVLEMYYGIKRFDKTLWVEINENKTIGTLVFDGKQNEQFQATMFCVWSKHTYKISKSSIIPNLQQNVMGNHLAEWDPKLKISSIRIYGESSLTFTLQWQCPTTWYKTPRGYNVQCQIALLNKNCTSSCDRCLSLGNKSCSKLCFQNYESYGPSVTIKVPWNNTETSIKLRINGIRRIVDENPPNTTGCYGCYTYVFIPIKSMGTYFDIFKHDFMTGYGGSFLYEKPELKRYFVNSILLHGNVSYPLGLSSAQIKDLGIRCRMKAVPAVQPRTLTSEWSNIATVNTSTYLLNVHLLLIYMGPETVGDRRFLIELAFNSASQTFTLENLENGLGLAPMIDLAPNGIAKVNDSCFTDAEAYWNFKKCRWNSERMSHIPSYYVNKKLGCYHWIFKTWYIFLKSGHHFMLKSMSESDVSELSFGQYNYNIYDTDLPILYISAKNSTPIEMHCSRLNSLIFWSELDGEGEIFIKHLVLDPITGESPFIDPLNIDSVESDEEILSKFQRIYKHHENTMIDSDTLCKCSFNSTISIPIFDVGYTDPTQLNSFYIAALCGSSICHSKMEIVNWQMSLSSSSFIYDFSNNSHDIMSFTMDHQHIFYLKKSSREMFYHTFLHTNLQNSEKSSTIIANGPVDFALPPILPNGGYESIQLLKSELYLPVIPLNCIQPIMNSGSLDLNLVSESVGYVSFEVHWSTQSACLHLAKPAISYAIYYYSLDEYKKGFIDHHFGREEIWNQFRNITDLKHAKQYMHTCPGVGEFPFNPPTMIHTAFLSPVSGKRTIKTFRPLCHSSKTAATRNTTIQHALVKLIPGKVYFVQITPIIDIHQSLAKSWYGGTELPVWRMTKKIQYKPPYNNWTMVLSVTIPAVIIACLFLFAFIWWIKKRQNIYQYLSRISANDIIRNEMIGEGHFGEIWKAKFNKNQVVVVKLLKESASDKEEKEFRDEALLLSKLQSDFIVKTIGICLQSRPIMLAMEYINGGSLENYLRKYQVRSLLVTADLLHLVKDALSGCIYLENEGYVHRDLSARNCLVTLAGESAVSGKPKTVKISDFGLAKDIGQEEIYKSRAPNEDVLPVAWTAPEAFSGIFSSKSDVWSFGVMMWEVFSYAASPYLQCYKGWSHQCQMIKLNFHEIEYRVCAEKQTLLDFPEPCTAAFSSSLRNILSRCWEYKKEDRPNFQQLANFVGGAYSQILRETILPDFQDLIEEASEQEEATEESMVHPNPQVSMFLPAYGAESSSNLGSVVVPAYDDDGTRVRRAAAHILGNQEENLSNDIEQTIPLFTNR